jgi:hypothetical protein
MRMAVSAISCTLAPLYRGIRPGTHGYVSGALGRRQGNHQTGRCEFE